MNILKLANQVDDAIGQNEFSVSINKVGEFFSILIKPKDKDEIEFCRVGSVYAVKINDGDVEINKSDFEKILSPYIGKRMFLNLMVDFL